MESARVAIDEERFVRAMRRRVWQASGQTKLMVVVARRGARSLEVDGGLQLESRKLAKNYQGPLTPCGLALQCMMQI